MVQEANKAQTVHTKVGQLLQLLFPVGNAIPPPILVVIVVISLLVFEIPIPVPVVSTIGKELLYSAGLAISRATMHGAGAILLGGQSFGFLPFFLGGSSSLVDDVSNS